MLRSGFTPTSDPQIAAAIRRLEALAADGPEMAEAAALYCAILPRLHAAEAPQANLPAPKMDPEVARRKLAQGIPLLVGEDLPFDAAAAAELFVALCRAVERAGPGISSANPKAAVQMRRAVERGELDLAAVWPALAGGDQAALQHIGEGVGISLPLLALLGQNSLKPALRVQAEKLDGGVDLDGWQRMICPVCGCPPLLAEVQGKEGTRRLRCGMCGTGWRYPRLQCAVCGQADDRALGYILVRGEAEKYRVQICDVCSGYIKVITLVAPTPVDMLAVEDLATLHLDSLAAERGYIRIRKQA